MKRFVEGDDRKQVALRPQCVDDYIGQDNPVRIVDVFVDELDLTTLGFNGTTPATTERPSYHPCVMLKIYYKGFHTQHKPDGVPGVACCVACNV